MTTLNLVEQIARRRGSLFERLANTFRANMTRRVARHQLLRLDDRILSDIGLTRNSIQSDQF